MWERLCKVKNVAVEIRRERRECWEKLAQHLMNLEITSISSAEFEREVAKVTTTKPPFFQCEVCSLATRRNPHPPSTVAQLNRVGLCINPDCRTFYSPAVCETCGKPLPPDRSTDRECLSCWAELHLSPDEMYDDGEDEEDARD